MSNNISSQNFRRVLGRVTPQDFVGRAGELERVVAQAESKNSGRGLLLLMEPSAGVSELLRQAYDQIFNRRSEVIPIYFSITRNETTAVSAAIEFLNTFVQQYIAFRKDEPGIAHAPLTLHDLARTRTSCRLRMDRTGNRVVQPSSIQQRRQSTRAILPRRTATNSAAKRPSVGDGRWRTTRRVPERRRRVRN